jgi:hypothetical protein
MNVARSNRQHLSGTLPKVRLYELSIQNQDIVGLHGESRGEILLVQRLNTDENHAYTALLSLANPLTQIFVTAK